MSSRFMSSHPTPHPKVVVQTHALQKAHPSLTSLDVAWGAMLTPQAVHFVEAMDRAFRLTVSGVCM